MNTLSRNCAAIAALAGLSWAVITSPVAGGRKGLRIQARPKRSQERRVDKFRSTSDNETSF